MFQDTVISSWSYREPLIKDTVGVVLLLDFLEPGIILCEHQLSFIQNRIFFACNIWKEVALLDGHVLVVECNTHHNYCIPGFAHQLALDGHQSRSAPTRGHSYEQHLHSSPCCPSRQYQLTRLGWNHGGMRWCPPRQNIPSQVGSIHRGRYS